MWPRAGGATAPGRRDTAWRAEQAIKARAGPALNGRADHPPLQDVRALAGSEKRIGPHRVIGRKGLEWDLLRRAVPVQPGQAQFFHDQRAIHVAIEWPFAPRCIIERLPGGAFPQPCVSCALVEMKHLVATVPARDLQKSGRIGRGRSRADQNRWSTGGAAAGDDVADTPRQPRACTVEWNLAGFRDDEDHLLRQAFGGAIRLVQDGEKFGSRPWEASARQYELEEGVAQGRAFAVCHGSASIGIYTDHSRAKAGWR